MKGYLLDTSVALRATFRSVTLSVQVRHAIERGPVFLSVISYWEVMLKNMKGKLDIGDPRSWWAETVDRLAGVVLPLRPDHIGEIAHLPPLHSDPFDRALIAQARVEDFVLVTNDTQIAKYADSRLRILA